MLILLLAAFHFRLDLLLVRMKKGKKIQCVPEMKLIIG